MISPFSLALTLLIGLSGATSGMAATPETRAPGISYGAAGFPAVPSSGRDTGGADPSLVTREPTRRLDDSILQDQPTHSAGVAGFPAVPSEDPASKTADLPDDPFVSHWRKRRGDPSGEPPAESRPFERRFPDAPPTRSPQADTPIEKNRASKRDTEDLMEEDSKQISKLKKTVKHLRKDLAACHKRLKHAIKGRNAAEKEADKYHKRKHHRKKKH